MLIDPENGQELDATFLAGELSRKAHQLDRLNRLLQPVAADVARLESLLRLLPINSRVDAGDGWAVVVAPPAKRPPQIVRLEVAARYRTQLLERGLGEERTETTFHPPTIGAVRAAWEELLALGIPMDELAPDPGPGKPRVALVPVEVPAPTPSPEEAWT